MVLLEYKFTTWMKVIIVFVLNNLVVKNQKGSFFFVDQVLEFLNCVRLQILLILNFNFGKSKPDLVGNFGKCPDKDK